MTREVTYTLAGGIMKSGNPQSGRYEFVFETIWARLIG